MNYFESKPAAERHAKRRPYFQLQVMEKVKPYIKPNNLFNKAIDMGCGTGLSAIDLKNIAHKMIGVDSSAEMTALALKNGKIEYYVAHAECIPVSDHDFNWTNAILPSSQEPASSPTNRLLPGGSLVYASASYMKNTVCWQTILCRRAGRSLRCGLR